MSRPLRLPNPSDGPPAVTGREEGSRGQSPVGAGGAAAQTPRAAPANESGGRCRGHAAPPGGKGDSPSRGAGPPISPTNSLSGYQLRSPLFRHLSRSSSGYFSYDGDSLPGSPRPATVDKATQTPSPSGQAVTHAVLRLTEEHPHGSPSSPSRTQPPNTAGDMQSIGQELRRIGDDYNSLLMQRRPAGRHEPAVVPPNLLPHIHQEPTFLLCMGLLLLLIGRVFYLQGSTNSHQDHSRV
ncbi:bcl-2-like protein 11 isoform X2 [Myripristis murdjan]|uniref:bcl-2-like protein 11 isoform X2 n=1 Tax=Myripristis murdjan TaxID=586833 RepID=UPI00117634E3|nr:bcl-2-like protein 11 isoform X2 [Myripristis murdjan]